MPARKISKTKARKTPTQARSKKRVEAMIDAAAVEFAERGFDGATTEAIAARAGASIGSLYQFFPNKMALFQAMAERCLERTKTVFDTVMPVSSAQDERPWIDLVEQSIDAFFVFQRTDPAFRAISMNLQLYGVYEEADNALSEEFAARIQTAMVRLTPTLSPKDRKIVANIIVQVVTAILFFSFRTGDRHGKEYVRETKVLMRRYLEPYTV